MKYIYGISKSGKSIIDYLDQIDENYFCWDDNKKVRDKLKRLNNKIKLMEPKKLDYNLIDESYISPGISLKNKKINILKDNNVKLYRDLELYSRLTKDKKIIAITGTNGKSTTTKLISDLLNISSLNNFLGGNIGIPLLDFYRAEKKIHYHVIELSSFQLESFVSFHPYISILLNLSPDHLDRYENYDEYIAQKKKIFNLNKKTVNIMCVDYQKTYDIYNQNSKKIIPISINPLKRGIYYKNNIIIDNYFPVKKNVNINLLSPSLNESFNIENILATYVVSRILDISLENFRNLIKNFKGLSHRSELIYKDKYLQIINNSKATNVYSSLKSIENYSNINLILGGWDKEKNFNQIINHKNKINKAYLIGEAALTIFEQLKKEIDCEICNTLDIAINKIFLDIKNKIEYQTILLSPACKSFDQFRDFEERGNYFKKLIEKKINA